MVELIESLRAELARLGSWALQYWTQLVWVSGWLVAIVSWFRHTAQIEFQTVEREPEDEIGVEAVNVGKAAATNIEINWRPFSPCTLRTWPRSILLRSDQALSLVFVIDQLDLMTYQIPEFSVVPAPLGYLELTYAGRFRWRTKRGFSLLTSSQLGSFGKEAVYLESLSIIPLRVRYAWVNRIWRWLTQQARKERKTRISREKRNAEWFARSRAVLASKGIHPQPNGYDRDRLLAELGVRRWEWKFGPGGDGYEVRADKTWWPSTSSMIEFSAPTLEEALVKVLASAIQQDEEQLPASSSQAM